MDALGNELNRLLVDTYRAAGKIEQIMLDDLSDGKLSMAEMRAIECVGGSRRRGMTVTEISQELDITLPSVTAMMKRLEQKGYVLRKRCTDDARQVRIWLTEPGMRAYIGYLVVQRRMINAVRQGFEADDAEVLVRSLRGLNEFFRQKMEELSNPDKGE